VEGEAGHTAQRAARFFAVVASTAPQLEQARASRNGSAATRGARPATPRAEAARAAPARASNHSLADGPRRTARARRGVGTTPWPPGPPGALGAFLRPATGRARNQIRGPHRGPDEVSFSDPSDTHDIWRNAGFHMPRSAVMRPVGIDIYLQRGRTSCPGGSTGVAPNERAWLPRATHRPTGATEACSV
jgi:hypothetical protein